MKELILKILPVMIRKVIKVSLCSKWYYYIFRNLEVLREKELKIDCFNINIMFIKIDVI